MTLLPTFAASAADWFDVKEIAPATWLISEPGHVNSYLMTSPTGSLLFDSGTGIASIVDAIASLVQGPLTVVNSHSHLDHVGGNGDLLNHSDRVRLKEICGHPKTAYSAPMADREFLNLYADQFAMIAQRHAEYRELDDAFFFALADQPRMREMPDTSRWCVPFVQPHRFLADGEVLEVGDRTFVVIHAPGHSEDSLVLFEPASRTLYSGDTVITAAMWCHGEGADLNALNGTLRRLEQLDISTILCAHNLVPQVGRSYLARVRRATESVLAGETVATTGHDLLGTSVDRHCSDGITILLPLTSRATQPLIQSVMGGQP